MPTNLPMSNTLTACTIVGVTAVYLAYHQHYTLPHKVLGTSTIPRSLHDSALYQQTINPSSHPATTSSHSIILPRPRSSHDGQYESDEEILRRFTLGFWGGWTFTPELNLLRWVRPKAMMIDLPVLRSKEEDHFARHTDPTADKAPADAIVNRAQREVWSRQDLHEAFHVAGSTDNPARPSGPFSLKQKVGLTLFGAFRVADIQLNEDEQVHDDRTFEAMRPRNSFINFVYGTNTAWIRGVHRFEVYTVPAPAASTAISAQPSIQPAPTLATSSTPGTVQQQPQAPASARLNATAKEEWICICFSSASINPRDPTGPVGGRFWSAPLAWFHGVYAGLLFRDGIREVLRCC